MRLLKWTPFFDIKEESPIAPTWVSFPNLRSHMFNTHIFFALALIFGRPLQTDQSMALLSLPFMDRILDKMDVSKKHPKETWLGPEIGAYLQNVFVASGCSS
ncbi:hypothetical protein KFK09_009543 [Dendrobium nobile]|uniref:DUF4283 domain-containing protein n=1 Tax=Dendrobium nobile TaxID=94219 RepID=A0A8T3BL80_DENNO|nr:hypothetical protein KFK09_009543 [Dendrobium nobile]